MALVPYQRCLGNARRMCESGESPRNSRSLFPCLDVPPVSIGWCWGPRRVGGQCTPVPVSHDAQVHLSALPSLSPAIRYIHKMVDKAVTLPRTSLEYMGNRGL